MALKRMAVEFGMGTDLRGEDQTKAAIRAVKDALWHNSLNLTDAFGFPREAMIIEAVIGVPKPDEVDAAAVAEVFPYGSVTVRAEKGGLEIERTTYETRTIVANAAVVVSFDLAEQSP